MKKAHLIAFCLLIVGMCHAQSRTEKQLHFDLSKIGFVVNGRQIYEDKGRLQDYPSKVMDQIIAGGPKSVPVLIGMLTDSGMAKTEEPIICYWPGMTVGDIAFCTLEDLFLNADWTKATVPGAGWNDMLGPDEGLPAWEQLRRFIRTHGRKALQVK
ncbi:MAG TPA: hypothetical protein VF845_02600, partial [Terriglobales bacterium]